MQRHLFLLVLTLVGSSGSAYAEDYLTESEIVEMVSGGEGDEVDTATILHSDEGSKPPLEDPSNDPSLDDEVESAGGSNYSHRDPTPLVKKKKIAKKAKVKKLAKSKKTKIAQRTKSKRRSVHR